nr:alpha,alpha-trehalase [Legionella jordanis]
MRSIRKFKLHIIPKHYSALVFLIWVSFSQAAFSADFNAIDSQIAKYIDDSWTLLTRDNWLKCSVDPKLSVDELIVYLPRTEAIEQIKNKNPEWARQVKFAYLPEDARKIEKHGLLYLPHPYVVPGGRFNEQYAWDSYFIVLGLLESNRLTQAKQMIDNLIYELRHYGILLNANRSYYLGRTQPPLLTEMILAYYRRDPDKVWLNSTLPAIKTLHHHWTTPPRAIPAIGLSRYYSGGEGQTPEESQEYYSKVLSYFKTHPTEGEGRDNSLFYDTNGLTALFYIADRTIRESGFDITAKYGPFGIEILDFAAVDLNVLLYQMELDGKEIHEILGNKKEALQWQARANHRAHQINQFLWDESTGYYLDYNFKQKKRKYYPYATTFYPLWAGIASKKQAEALLKHMPEFLRNGGIVTSTHNSGLQWDYPFGWAPMQYFAVFGLERYGYHQLALEVAAKFMNTVKKGFEKDGAIFEKYDVISVSSRTEDKIKYSYSTNEVGFGWTNGVYLVFSNFLKTHLN